MLTGFPPRRLSDAEMVCVGCHKHPSQIEEYRFYGVSPARYVWDEEGTLNRRNGNFRCTECYIKAGMPEGVTP